MSKSPIATALPRIDVVFNLGNSSTGNVGELVQDFEWHAFFNNGYGVSGKIIDANFNILRKLHVDLDYFRDARSSVFEMQYRLRWPGSDNNTDWQLAHVTNMDASGDRADQATLKFSAIDPPSWYLNCGDASGKVYHGNVSDAIKQCVAEYAPRIQFAMTETIDSKHNYWPMMRLDPKSFIASLIDWSSAVAPKRGQWIIVMDGTKMQIREQLEIQSQNVGFYRGPQRDQIVSDIQNWHVACDNALSLMNTKLLTSGMSAVSGQYLDRVTDSLENKVFAKDSNTPNKYKPKMGSDKSFKKPPDAIGAGPRQGVGWSAIPGIPEVFSAGDLGIPYESYLSGRPRQLYMGMTNLIQRARFSVLGHGIYTNCFGLGQNTITIDWMDINEVPFFLSGNWIIYGYQHHYRVGRWTTDLYCARTDFDAVAKAVP